MRLTRTLHILMIISYIFLSDEFHYSFYSSALLYFLVLIYSLWATAEFYTPKGNSS